MITAVSKQNLKSWNSCSNFEMGSSRNHWKSLEVSKMTVQPFGMK